MYTDILIRFGELSTKGKNKMTFVRQLEKNIKNLMGVSPRVEFDRIFMEYSKENIVGLKKIFGIHSYSPVTKINTSYEEIKSQVLKEIEFFNDQTFKVVVKRHWKKYPSSSMEMARELGSLILENSNMSVNIKNPEVKVEIEIREKFTYVFVKRYKGLGGYPTGVNGKVLHLISGGIDSPVAALEMMKRGIHVDFINFITPPHTDNKTIDKVNRIIKLVTSYQGKSILYRSKYTDLMNLIGLTSNQAYKINLMRRSFYRIASSIAKKNKYLGISNGDNLGQVASQTLESILTIQAEALLPIYRPILTSDKLETITKGIKIGTYEISIERANEACEIFAPKAPVIKPTIKVAKKLENELFGLKELEQKNLDEKIDKILFNMNKK